MISRRFHLLWLLLFGASSVQAEIVSLQLGPDMALFQYVTESLGRIELEGSYLYAKNGDNSDYLLQIGGQVRGESDNAPIIVTVGGRMYYGQANNSDIGGLGLGGALGYAPESWNGFGLGGYLYFVPNIVAFSDTNSMLEYGISGHFQVSSQAIVVLGFKQLNADIVNKGSYSLVSSPYVGVDLYF